MEIELPSTKYFPLIFNLLFNHIPNNNDYLRPLNPPITSLSCIYSFYVALSNIECSQCFWWNISFAICLSSLNRPKINLLDVHKCIRENKICTNAKLSLVLRQLHKCMKPLWKEKSLWTLPFWWMMVFIIFIYMF